MRGYRVARRASGLNPSFGENIGVTPGGGGAATVAFGQKYLRVPDIQAKVSDSAGHDVSRRIGLPPEVDEFHRRVGGSTDNNHRILRRLVPAAVALVHVEERASRGVIGLAPIEGDAALDKNGAV